MLCHSGSPCRCSFPPLPPSRPPTHPLLISPGPGPFSDLAAGLYDHIRQEHAKFAKLCNPQRLYKKLLAAEIWSFLLITSTIHQHSPTSTRLHQIPSKIINSVLQLCYWHLRTFCLESAIGNHLSSLLCGAGPVVSHPAHAQPSPKSTH